MNTGQKMQPKFNSESAAVFVIQENKWHSEGAGVKDETFSVDICVRSAAEFICLVRAGKSNFRVACRKGYKLHLQPTESVKVK